MEILIFGNQTFPDISFTMNPQSGLEISCKNNYVVWYGGIEGTVSWKDLMERTHPNLAGWPPMKMDPRVRRCSMATLASEWPQTKNCLGQMVQSKGERAFLEGYFSNSEYFLDSQGHDDATDDEITVEMLSRPALIPQAWLNWIHPVDEERAARTKKEPFRVDFVIFSQGRKLVIEIDGTSHFSEILDIDNHTGQIREAVSLRKYSEHLKKDRWLRSQGWEVWRFSNEEVFDTNYGVIAVLEEMKLLNRMAGWR